MLIHTQYGVVCGEGGPAFAQPHGAAQLTRVMLRHLDHLKQTSNLYHSHISQ